MGRVRAKGAPPISSVTTLPVWPPKEWAAIFDKIDAAPSIYIERPLMADGSTIERLTILGRLGAPIEDIATILGVKKETLKAFLDKRPECAFALEEGRAQGRTMLRYSQHLMSQYNPAMAIWRGKNELGQTDKTDVNLNGRITWEALLEESMKPARIKETPAIEHQPEDADE